MHTMLPTASLDPASSIPFNPIRLAAIVYDDGVAVDALMMAFADELIREGAQICGIVQMPPEEPDCGPRAPMRVQDIATGEIISLCQDLGPDSSSCRLSLAGLAEAAARLRLAAERRSELVFVSRFGKQEAAGRGFRDEFAYAVGAGRTILTAVQRGLVHNWMDFTGGVGTLLDHRLWVLKNWWTEVRAAEPAFYHKL